MNIKIKPIKTEQDYKEALEKVSKLMSAKINTPEGDALDVLTTLIEVYEAKHYPIDPPDPIEAIKFRLDQENLSRNDLATILKVERGRVSEILSKKRALSINMIRVLYQKLRISPEVLMRTYPLAKKASTLKIRG
ncbi:helix-turn-helix domain-containing protein [Candidatus Nucleicultrix amoebiphila]|jgi:HTH-type transcriptional regulator/antitoxin HigA|uniref:DNA-binding protein n=1 Tax=Candidatus Nucleicultrix amoebiphila FS5 TaxID=1414854 RepID=A0A1W6N4J6_9PROT|nr:hypothetical protein [Candidatus Nucleicultrix amoebiphila]ARN84807.1 DNA-binding protein [Candidatus Nucleicultrix amoebiphila FS5]